MTSDRERKIERAKERMRSEAKGRLKKFLLLRLQAAHTLTFVGCHSGLERKDND
jgi:hypothetical protein